MDFDLRKLSFISHRLNLFTLLLSLVDKSSILFFIFEFSLIDLLAVLLVLMVGLFREIPPLVNHLVQLFLQTITLNHLFLLSIKSI